MVDAAVHLEQRVLPAVPIRHWIGSLPWGLRALLGYDRRLCAQVVGAFAQEPAQGVSVTGDRAGQPTPRLVVSRDPPAPAKATDAGAADEPCAEVRGVNLHAKQLVDGRDRRQLERLCKYITRPPVAQDRLELRPDGRLELTLKGIWRDGTRALVLEPNAPFGPLGRSGAAAKVAHAQVLRGVCVIVHPFLRRRAGGACFCP